jgi:hypothetical protein
VVVVVVVVVVVGNTEVTLSGDQRIRHSSSNTWAAAEWYGRSRTVVPSRRWRRCAPGGLRRGGPLDQGELLLNKVSKQLRLRHSKGLQQ